MLCYDPLESELGTQSAWCPNFLIGGCAPYALPRLPPMCSRWTMQKQNAERMNRLRSKNKRL